MEKEIAVNDVVQIDPGHDEHFGGSFLVVAEVRSWGVIGFVQIPGNDGGRAFYRCPTEGYHRIGSAEWVVQRETADS